MGKKTSVTRTFEGNREKKRLMKTIVIFAAFVTIAAGAGATEDREDAEGPRRQNENSIDASQVRQRNEDKANVAQFTFMKRGRNANEVLRQLFPNVRGTCKEIGEICPFDEKCCSRCCRPPSDAIWRARRCQKVEKGKYCLYGVQQKATLF